MQSFHNSYFYQYVCYIFINMYERAKNIVQIHCYFFIIFIIIAEFAQYILHFTKNDIIILTTYC